MYPLLHKYMKRLLRLRIRIPQIRQLSEIRLPMYLIMAANCSKGQPEFEVVLT